ncbi:VC0807 family protein [Pseudofrankia inefficax]|uniref:Uncharacterized protein n=1 Tax=Pseudofrankia inefficax (strain DSM 45817 / CECT 9037 / DDB 130130 / EuI1c) TaxID=298654 RepID=E3JD52_PSEI1|nr:VC0807 family protein [Pseudofrankia inefficax]ADP82336.1 hypothetical protein FraEuI1c_4337 [Pseudofrankia inefficax]
MTFVEVEIHSESPGSPEDGRLPGDSPSPAATADGAASGGSVAVKARILAFSLVDIVVDLLLPTVVYAALAPTGRSAAVRLTVGGFAVAAKSVTGEVRDAEGAGRRSRVLAGVAVAALAGAVTLVAAYAGASDTWAIVAGTVALGLGAVPLLSRRRRIDGFALLVLVEVAMSVALVTVSTDPRFILVRPAFYTAVAGVYAIITCWTARPLMMEVSRPMAAGGDPVRAAAFDRAWTTSGVFRRVEQAMTFGLGIVLLLEALLRVALVYSHSRSDLFHASVASQLPGLVLFVGYLVAIRLFAVPIASREVDAEVAHASAESLSSVSEEA